MKFWVLTASILISLISASTSFTFEIQKTGDDRKLEREAARLDLEARHIQENDQVLTSLSKSLGVPVETLSSQKQSTGFGFGQLLLANSLSRATGLSFDQLAAQFQSGKGWGRIARERGVNLGEIVSGIRKSTAALREVHQADIRVRQGDQRLDKQREREENRVPADAGQGRGQEKSRRRGP